MTMKRIWILVSVVIALSIGAAVLLHEDRYGGRTMGEWLVLTHDVEAADAAHAATVIRQIPKEKLLPLLRDWITAREGSLKERVFQILAKQRVVKILHISAHEKHRRAFEAITILGPDAAPLVPDLSAVLAGQEPENVFDSAFALCAIGPEAKSTLTHSIPDESRQARMARQGALALSTTPEFAAAAQNWASQTVLDVRRLLLLFHMKCLGAGHSSRPPSRVPSPED